VAVAETGDVWQNTCKDNRSEPSIGTMVNEGTLDGMGMDRGMRERQGHGLVSIAVVLLTQLACRPIVTVGWQELAIFLVIAAIVLVPLIMSLIRWLSGLKSFWRSPGRKKGRKE